MGNDKVEKRKRTLADRARREREEATRLARRAKYPNFVFDSHFADREFAAVVQAAVRKFDFAELPTTDQLVFKMVRENGAAAALRTLDSAMLAARAQGHDTPYAHVGDALLLLNIGEVIFRKISETDRERFFPLNDFRIIPRGREILVQSSSLVPTDSRKRAYFSRFRPAVTFNEKRYVVAFSRHAVERLQRRLQGSRMDYAGLGDVSGYLELCNHFEPCTLRGDGDRRDEALAAITFYQGCWSDAFWNQGYVHEVLGSAFDATKGKPYYRVGYCPLVFDGEFAVATSFLPPGYAKTPEFLAVRRSRLPPQEKRRLQEMATDDEALLRLVENDDFSAVRAFHENGVPQVVQTHEEWFRAYG